MKLAYIYLLRFPNGPMYVGSTTDPVKRLRRYTHHFAYGAAHSRKLRDALDTYGVPEFEVIKQVPAEDSDKEEAAAIKEYDAVLNKRSPVLFRARTLVVAGEELTYAEASSRWGRSVSSIAARISRGLTPAQAVGAEPTPAERARAKAKAAAAEAASIRRERMLEVNGRRASLAAHCRRYNLNYQTIRYRWTHGWPIELLFPLERHTD